jgi:hypothetical protein
VESVEAAEVELELHLLQAVVQAAKAQSYFIGRSKCYLRKNLVLFQQGFNFNALF